MIARLWHGRTSRAKADEYLAFLRARALPDYRSTPGNLAAHVLRRDEGEVTHFMTLTFWDTLESIGTFAGADVLRAKYYPEDAAYLLEFEPMVQHFDAHS